jgi:ParB family chromosome partitioning protein
MSDELPLAAIKIGVRQRRELGDIEALMESIRTVGLLHPLVVRPDGLLIAGFRRHSAIKRLGWDQVPVTVVTGLDEARQLLLAERDENVCRKDFLPSEAVALGLALEEIERPKAKERQQATRAKKGKKVGAAQGGGNLPPPCAANGKSRDKVGEAVGLSGQTYQRAKAVVESAPSRR